MNRSLKSLALFAALVPALALAAGSWWNNDWKYRKEIGFDLSPTGADIAGSPQDVPILVRLSLANFSYFNDTKPDGADFRVLAGDDKTPLKFHFEKYDPQNQMALLWVRVPLLSGGAKTDKIYAYYGNADAAPAGDAAGTYDASQVLVLSFSGGTGTPADLTAYKNNPSASTATLTPAALIGGGAQFAGNQSLTVPSSPSLRLLPGQGLTASAWVRIAQAQQATILALTDAGKDLSLGIDGTHFYAQAKMDGAPVTVSTSADFTLNAWHHVALTASAGKLTLYVDGVAVGSAPVTLEEVGGALTIGAMHEAQFLSGDLDEVEVAKVARSSEWIKAAALGQGMDSKLVIYGADGQKEGGSQGSYFGTVAKNLTVDGWVVIGICMAMLVIALLIMVVKAVFLSQVEKANARFLAQFRLLTGDARVLADPPAADSGAEKETGRKHADAGPADLSIGGLWGSEDKFGVSTLYRIYHSGVFELNKRIEGATASAQRAQILSSQTINAIRASMDATLTRVQQQLSSRMVLLTIAISGGPFLGLLGTVIGVMITFAAIAQSGDVNVNAIAPGTAAALAATVAGLAVAIPSLFGYNWLNTRIKAITADNRVLVDEFVARVAEQYS